MMTKDFKDLLRAFNANAVKYLIIGAHAFGVQFAISLRAEESRIFST
jgi:hypothetical protein